MAELLATARAMEIEAIAGYEDLARQMARSGQTGLAAVFERLATEERGHLASVEIWSDELGGTSSIDTPMPDEMFDDEGMRLIDPLLVSAYRAFSVAVRNEERAFLFWTYVAAHAPEKRIAEAAERMAREELGHVATLRRERRLAFHRQRQAHTTEMVPVKDLERRLADQLRDLDRSDTKLSRDEVAARLAQEARQRVSLFETRTIPLDRPADGMTALSIGALTEILLDFYLGEAESSKEEDDRSVAQTCAGQLVAALATLRGKTG